MAQDRTSGYDMLVQISESEINNQLATAFLAGTLLPTTMSVPVNSGGLVGTANLNFTTPVADLDRPRPRMGITLPFVNSELILTMPAPLTLSPLSGFITIVDDIQMNSDPVARTQTMLLDFNAGAPAVTVVFDAASSALLAPLLTAGGLSLGAAQIIVADSVLGVLQTGLRRVTLSAAIPVVDDTDPVTVFDIDVTTINDTSGSDRDCIVLGIKTDSSSGGNINGVTANFIPPGNQSLLMMSNFWLLAKVMRPMVANTLDLEDTDFDTPLRLNRDVPAPGGRGRLTKLEARIDGNRIRVDGIAVDSGTGWSAEAKFFFFVDVALSGGSLTVTATTPDVDTDVDLEWWVWLTSLGLGGLFFGITGVIVSAVVLAIVKAVAEGIVSNLISNGVSGSFADIPPVPLGPIGSGLSLSSVLLDDLEFRCSIVKSVTVPVKNRGQHSSLSGFTLDLERGAIGTAVNRSTDLIWNPATGISIANTAGITVTNDSYGSLTPVQISRMPLNQKRIPLGYIPFSFQGLPFFPRQELVFGVRTAEGRFAKVKAYRSALEGGALKLEWITYDTPVPSLEIISRWVAEEEDNVNHYITSDCQNCTARDVKWRGVFDAKAKLMAFPIDYQWCVCGNILKDKSGVIESSGNKIGYEVEGSRLIIYAEKIGQDIDCEVCVSAIDFKARELFVCTKANKKGRDVKCRKCEDKSYLIDFIHVPLDIETSKWRQFITDASRVSKQVGGRKGKGKTADS